MPERTGKNTLRIKTLGDKDVIHGILSVFDFYASK